MKFAFAGHVLDTDGLSLHRDGTPVAVEPQVFDLIWLLARNAGRVVSRDEIVAAVWDGRIVSESAISARIAAARKALGDTGKDQAVIRTVARRGLQMVAEVAREGGDERDAEAAPAPEIQRIRYARNRDGHALAWALTGRGAPLLHMEPLMTCDLELEWNMPVQRKSFDALGRRCHLLRFDHLGGGQSDRDHPEFDLDRLADNALAVADAAGFDRFGVFAESGGALVAIHLAARYPRRVTRLAITGGYADGRLRRGPSDGPEPIRGMIEAGWDKPDGAFAAAFLLSYFPDGPLDSVRALARLMQRSCPPDTMLALRDLINTASVAHLLPQVRCPTLILHARDDAVHPLSEARKLAAGIAGAELVVLETANHIPLPGNAVWDSYMDTLLGFLGG